MPESANRSLSRGLAMLELLAAHPSGLDLSQLSRMLAVPKSSAHNLAATLVDMGYAQKSGSLYRLDIKMFEVGASAVNSTEIPSIIRAHMRETLSLLNETLHLGVPSGRYVVYVDKLDSTQSIHMSSRIGLRAPMYATAMGKAVLACYPEERVEAMYQGASLAPFTANTVASLPALQEQLRAARELGYAVEREEFNVNVCCAAAAIVNREGEPVYALSASVPVFRFTPDREKLISEALVRVKREVERYIKVK